MTLFLYDKLNDREILFKNKFGFVLPLNTHSYNFIKTAYVLNKKLCVEYFDTGGSYIINRMFDDYLIDG
ncbi:hypothetical protein L9H26_02600 [Morganella psychrotolerans]|uniref:Uncharacterized protein n=1 Tax=Morganella psychrotolerans TaxID=368603 RepID=A0A5M9RAY3_9GAMM|nr:hypothetical protein [Morganella psychrotolerans]KAA8717723.1 hypothetical protein F4V73_07745 [Morganella psychrotolerans]